MSDSDSIKDSLKGIDRTRAPRRSLDAPQSPKGDSTRNLQVSRGRSFTNKIEFSDDIQENVHSEQIEQEQKNRRQQLREQEEREELELLEEEEERELQDRELRELQDAFEDRARKLREHDNVWQAEQMLLIGDAFETVQIMYLEEIIESQPDLPIEEAERMARVIAQVDIWHRMASGSFMVVMSRNYVLSEAPFRPYQSGHHRLQNDTLIQLSQDTLSPYNFYHQLPSDSNREQVMGDTLRYMLDVEPDDVSSFYEGWQRLKEDGLWQQEERVIDEILQMNEEELRQAIYDRNNFQPFNVEIEHDVIRMDHEGSFYKTREKTGLSQKTIHFLLRTTKSQDEANTYMHAQSQYKQHSSHFATTTFEQEQSYEDLIITWHIPLSRLDNYYIKEQHSMTSLSTENAKLMATAYLTAKYRAMESERSHPLLQDSLAHMLVDSNSHNVEGQLPVVSGEVWGVAVRTNVFDRMITSLLKTEKIDAVLNLAAGLDTRPYRLHLPADLRWIEVDFPELINYKTEKLQAEQPKCKLERVGLDLLDLPARKALFDRVAVESERVLVITEGLLSYLQTTDVAALATDITAQPHFQWWMTEFLPAYILGNQVPDAPIKKAKGAESVQFAPEKGIKFFTEFGWKEAEFYSIYGEARRLKRDAPNGWLVRGLEWLGRLTSEDPDDHRHTGGFVLLENTSHEQ